MAASPVWAAGRPMKTDDLLAVKGVSEPQLSPDGSLVVYVVSESTAPPIRRPAAFGWSQARAASPSN